MNWKRILIEAITKKKYKAFLEDTKYPEIARERLWQREILPLLKKSVYWPPILKELHYESLNNFAITTYQDYEKSFLLAQENQTQPLNGEQIIFWSETSGTSGVRKFFPITRSFQKQFQRTMPPFIYGITQLFPEFFEKKLVYLVAINPTKTTPAGIPLGWVSNFNYRNLPGFVKRSYALPDEVFTNIEVYEQWAPLYALASDLNAFFSVTPMVIDIFYRRCVDRFSHFLPYLLGEQSVPEWLPPVQISKSRRRYLSGLAKNAPHSFKELWPSLLFVGCWTSGLCEYPAQLLKKLLGTKITVIDGTYSATEGWMTVPVDTNPGGYLHPGGHIAEFIEEGKEICKENIIQSWELETGKNYEIFLTTAMGLVRYQLKDVVHCLGFLNKSPRLVFCYKVQQLKLEYCAIAGQELQQMIDDLSFNMESYWYFARNSLGNCVVLVTEENISISDSLLMQMHERLGQINQAYAHGITVKEILPMVLLQLPKEVLLAEHHAQSKPKLISQHVITQK
ncbi:hypothetical protein TUM19329_05830 [Legionella antarctica]|uniref:GH3 middle domain-containing protein n=1 Tax=Legionella antarctica TaxID=2708020 RepID=A0A6F8T2H7_9GAMM|nr:GH3 auxin-responsive promoter family protein [Legionella antarctica]BCA94222.1 hypothetical protein TUM19329_05830 [Legionella antarctica]